MTSPKAPELPVSEGSSGPAARWVDFSNGLRWPSARTAYNVADALVPGCTADLAPELARRLRHEGPGAARRLWLWLAFLDWEPLLTFRARSRFWRLPREQRAAAVERWRCSRLASRRRAFAGLVAVLEAAGVGVQSSEGA